VGVLLGVRILLALIAEVYALAIMSFDFRFSSLKFRIARKDARC
jgi:hypothetical protein